MLYSELLTLIEKNKLTIAKDIISRKEGYENDEIDHDPRNHDERAVRCSACRLQLR